MIRPLYSSSVALGRPKQYQTKHANGVQIMFRSSDQCFAVMLWFCAGPVVAIGADEGRRRGGGFWRPNVLVSSRKV
jgi:hypothetical protein